MTQTFKHTWQLQPRDTTNETYPYPVSCKKRSTVRCEITMTDQNKIAILQSNPTGISVAEQTLLNKYFNDLKPDFVALNESKIALPQDYFNNYRTFSQNQNTNIGGVSLPTN